MSCTGRVLTNALETPREEEPGHEAGPETREQEQCGKDEGHESHMHGRPFPSGKQQATCRIAEKSFQGAA